MGKHRRPLPRVPLRADLDHPESPAASQGQKEGFARAFIAVADQMEAIRASSLRTLGLVRARHACARLSFLLHSLVCRQEFTAVLTQV